MQKETTIQYSLIIPCFNEEKILASEIKKLVECMEAIPRSEIVVVNDGSTDGSAKELKRLCEEYNNLRVETHESNIGYGAALKTGIRRTNGEYIIITDVDGTYPHEKIEELIKVAGDSDMVVGSRTGDLVDYPFIRKIPKYFLERYANWLCRQQIPDLNSGMRVVRREVLDRFVKILPDGFSFTTTITLAMMTNYYVVKFVPINYNKRVGSSKIRPIRDTWNIFQLIIRTGMYFAPIRVFSPVLTLLAMLFLISLGYDIFWLQDLTDKTVLLFLFCINTGMFLLLADMLDKRSLK